MMKTERKNVTAEILKAEDSGEVTSLIATMNVIDKDQDVTLKGFFGEQATAMVWGHDWLEPLGTGKVHEETRTPDGGSKADVAIFDGQFLMDVPSIAARQKTVKGMGPHQEWSYGFRILDGGAKMGTFSGQPVRFLQPIGDGPGVKVDEVSPVLVGAGEGTQTLSMKGMKFSDQLDAVVTAVEESVARASEIRKLREAEGKSIGTESREALESLRKQLEELIEVLTSPDPDPSIDPQTEFAKYQALVARINGVTV